MTRLRILLDKGQYLGESNAGIGGKLIVRVTYDNGIKNVEIVQNHESEDVGKRALKVIPERIVKKTLQMLMQNLVPLLQVVQSAKPSARL